MGRAILIIGAGALLVGIWIYGLIDAVRAEKSSVRALPKWAWVLVTFLVPVLGCLLWLFLGRPRGAGAVFGRSVRVQDGAMKAPDDDEDYLRFLEQKERRLKREREEKKSDEDETES